MFEDFDVAVHDTGCVEGFQPVGEALCDSYRLVDGKLALGFETVFERAALDVADHEVLAPVGLAGFHDRHEVAIPNLPGGPHLLPEAPLEGVVFGQLALQHLDRDDVAVPLVGRTKDQPHSALSDQGVEPIRPERVAGLELTVLPLAPSSHCPKNRSGFGTSQGA